MANAYINIYKNNPTEGETDGTTVSTDGSYTAPINFELDASQNEVQTVKLAIRTEYGYVTVGTTTISDENDTADRLKLSWEENGNYTDSIATDDEITSANKIFYVRGSSSSDEKPRVDRSANLLINCAIAAV